MATLDELLDAIAAAPAGPQVARVLRLRRHGDRRLLGVGVLPPPHPPRRDRAASSWRGRCSASARGIGTGEDFEKFLKMALGAWRGRSEEEVAGIAERLLQARDRRAHALGGVAAGRRPTTRRATASCSRRRPRASRSSRWRASSAPTTSSARRSRSSTASSPGARAGPVLWGEGKAARRARARRRARSRPRRVLRLLQRRRGRAVPRGGRPPGLHRPRVGPGDASRERARLAGPARARRGRRCPAPRRRRAHGRLLRRDGRRGLGRRRHRPAAAARAGRWSTSPAASARTSASRWPASTSTSSTAPSTCGRRGRACSSSTTRASSTRS